MASAIEAVSQGVLIRSSEVSPICGDALTLEHNGDLYSCDHFVKLDYRVGNIQQALVIELVASERQRNFGRDKFESLPK